MRQAHSPIRRAVLMHIDRNFVRRGPVDPKRFFKQVDLTPKVASLSRQIESQLDDMFATMRLKKQANHQNRARAG